MSINRIFIRINRSLNNLDRTFSYDKIAYSLGGSSFCILHEQDKVKIESKKRKPIWDYTTYHASKKVDNRASFQ